MTQDLVPPNGEGHHHVCYRGPELETLNKRVDRVEVGQGEILAEASAAKREASAAHQATLALADRLTEFSEEVRKERLAYEKECQLRHKAVDAELEALRATDDTLEAKSGLQLAMADPEKMVSRYEALKSDHEELKSKVLGLEQAKAAEAEARAKAEESTAAKEKERAAAQLALYAAEQAEKRANIKAWAGLAAAIIAAVAGAVVAILQAM